MAKLKATSTRQRGAKRQRRALFKPAIHGLLVCGFVATLVVAGYFGKTLVDQAAQRPINSIGVEGQFVYISQGVVSELVAPMIVGGFLQSPLSGIRDRLESNPWIARAAVSRRWPDKLFISIVEEQPIARWGGSGFLNHKGNIVEVEPTPQLQSLPLLSGETGQEKAVMQSYQQLAQLLRPHGLKVSEFYSDSLLSWHVVLANGLEIAIGRDQTMEKIQRFLVVYNRELHARVDDIAKVDLRYGNGLAVQWKTVTAESAGTAEDKKA